MIISNGFEIEVAFGVAPLQLKSFLMHGGLIWCDRSSYIFSTKKFAKKLIQ